MKNKIKGLFYGQLIGDALGARYEFTSKINIEKMLNEDVRDGILQMKGGGFFKLLPGQYTDDSDLCLCIWEAILNKNGNINRISENFIKWYNSNPIDIGNATEKAFHNALNYRDIKKNAKKYNINSLSNGCLMKISAVASIPFLLKENYKNMIKMTKKICRMTNPNKICVDICVVYIKAIYYSIKFKNIEKIKKIIKKSAKLNLTKQLIKDAEIQNKFVRLPNNDVINTDEDTQYIGYIGIAFQNALYQLFKNLSIHETIINTLKLGGDTDTNLCIALALYCAYNGYTSIPDIWIQTINNYENKKMPHLNHLSIFKKILKNY